MNIVVTGSIAFDYLMSFPGKFTEHFLPEHMSRVSLSFLVDTMDKRRGGCAPNIAYTLALLGERPRLMATAGQDFGDYRRWLEAAGVDTSLVKEVAGQVHRVVLLQHRSATTTRSRRSTPARWPTPASCRSARSDDCELAIISPNDPGRDGAVRGGVPRRSAFRYICDPGQQCARMSGDELRDGLVGADAGDLQRLRVRADAAEDRPGRGRDARAGRQRWSSRAASTAARCSPAAAAIDVPAVPPRRIVDPTGVGDAFRGGFLKGLALGVDAVTSAQLGSVAAAYALEHLGGQSHAYTWQEFRARYAHHFWASAGTGMSKIGATCRDSPRDAAGFS